MDARKDECKWYQNGKCEKKEEEEDDVPFKPTKQGCVYGVLSVFILSLLYLFTKYSLSITQLTPYEVLYARGILTIALNLIYFKCYNIYLFDIPANKTPALLGAAFTAFLGFAGFYTALNLLSISEAIALHSFAFIILTFLQFLAFNQKLRLPQILGYFSAFLGIICLVQPPYIFNKIQSIEEYQLYSHTSNKFILGLVSGLGGAFFMSIHYLISRKIQKNISYLIITTYAQFAFCLFSPLLVLINFGIRNSPTIYNAYELIFLLIQGVLSWLSYMLLNKALQAEKLISRVNSYQILFLAFIIPIDILFFQNKMSWITWLGIGLISGVNYLIIFIQFCFSRN